MKNELSINHFENEKYRIEKIKDDFADKFQINEINDIITLKRVDKKEGWGANVKLKIFNKIQFKEYIKEFGNSNDNIKSIQLEKIISTHHYENKKYKLYSVSNYNDTFKINYNESTHELNVKRIDVNKGWDQELKLEYYEKENQKIKYIQIGPSKNESKQIIINIEQLPYYQLPNTYEDKIIYIKKIKNEYEDTFEFEYNESDKIIKVKRLQTEEGWGQNLMISFLIKEKNELHYFYIGSSKSNRLYKKLYFKKPKIYISLTTIPSRANQKVFIQNIRKFIQEQENTYVKIEKIFINIPKEYKRFKEKINTHVIEDLKKIKQIEIIYLDRDYGPSSKYLGPLINNKFNIHDSLLIIIDDDRIYNDNLVKHFLISHQSYPHYEFYAGLWKYFFDKDYKYLKNNFLEITKYKEENKDNFKLGNGLGGFFGFCLKIKNKKEFIDYHLYLLDNYEKSFFHDEGITLGYLKKKELPIIYLKHLGCYEYKKESVDALCLSGSCDRSKVEKDILSITNNENLI